ncbi:MAG: anti-sigma factor [Myxococcota bacterium]
MIDPKILFGLVAASSLTLAACADEDASEDDPTPSGMASLALSFDGLEPLGADYVYEGWIIVDGAPVTSGRFTDVSTELTFDIPQDQADGTTTFVLTIEPAVGDDPAPSDVHVVAGDFTDGVANLTVGHPAALGDDFANAAGSYILETPTTHDLADDFDQGVWFLNPPAAMGEMPTASLDLPTLPAGWQYEGWVVGPDGAPVSTGTFLSGVGADSDGPGDAAGPDGAPPFPGQDFIDPASVLSGYAVVISIEPMPDDSPAPFAFKPLVDMSADATAAGMSEPLENMASTLATGTATFN